MRKISFLLVFILLINIFNINVVFGEEKQKIKIIYFGVDTCQSCQETKVLLDDFRNQVGYTFQSNKYSGIEIIYKNVNIEENRILQQSYSKFFNVPEDKATLVPALYIGDKYIVGKEEVKFKLKPLISSFYNGIQEYKEVDVPIIVKEEIKDKEVEKLNKFNPIGIFMAGLLDGFNPCAIAMLLFFISFLVMSGKNKKQILVVGLLYVLGTFLTYLLIGVGLFKFIYVFKNAKYVMLSIYIITFIISLILSIQSFIDYRNINKGDYSKVKLQLPKKIKHIIHNYIKENTITKVLYLSAFISGIVISCLEFFCTGQIYLPTIVYVLSIKTSIIKAFTYLILYNIAFVLPLIVICIALYKGQEVIDVSQTLVSKIHIIKLIVGTFFIIVSILMVLEVIKLLG